MHEPEDLFILTVEAAVGRLAGLRSKKWRVALEKEIALFPPSRQVFVRSYLVSQSMPVQNKKTAGALHYFGIIGGALLFAAVVLVAAAAVKTLVGDYLKALSAV